MLISDLRSTVKRDSDVQIGGWRGHLKSKKHLLDSYSEDDDQLSSKIPDGEYKKCCICKEFADVTLFDRPDSAICTQCDNNRLSPKKHGEISKCAISVGS